MKRAAIPIAVRREVLDAPCSYCEDLFPSEVDHVIPLSRGGSHDISNFAAACKACNREKLDFTPEEWKKWRLSNGWIWPPMSRWAATAELVSHLSDDANRRLSELLEARNERLINMLLRVFREAHRGVGIGLQEEASKMEFLLSSGGFDNDPQDQRDSHQ